jgi:transglutaminase-like putative cysteine protease
MSVTPEPSQHSVRTNVLGNSRAYFSIATPHTELLVVAASEVDVWSRYDGMVWANTLSVSEVAERLSYRARAPFEPASEFVYPSTYVPKHEELRQFAQDALQARVPIAQAVIDLMQRIHQGFTYAPCSTDVSTSILEVLQQRQGVCQDFAHLMIGCCRAAGLAAQYVSGYLLTEAPPGQAPILGADASHAWVSVWCPSAQTDQAGVWLDLDPTNNCIVDTRYVRVAHGRDFGDVTPLRGVIRGGGEHTIQVRVTTQVLPVPEATA